MLNLIKICFVFSLLAVINQLQAFSLLDSQKIEQKPTPEWVVQQFFNPNAMPEDRNQLNEFYLLIDKQQHVEEDVRFYHLAIKLLDEVGVENESNLQLSFDPSYQKLVIHHVQVIRGDKKIDKFAEAGSELIQRENDLEKRIYDGTVSYLLFLEDIRPGDILDYSYSITGSNKIQNPYLYSIFTASCGIFIDKMSYRLLASNSREITIKDHRIDAQNNIQVRDIDPSLREWTFEVHQVKATEFEEETPPWFELGNYIEYSEYANWETVAAIATKNFHLSKTYDAQCTQEMLDLIENWKEKHKTDADRVIAALRFVQDKIRYLHLNTETSSCIPNSPHVTFKKRFGDCKDKTQLLRFLLRQMNIESVPVLVNVQYGRNLPTWLPSPTNFDHAVLLVEINGESYWLDPTYTLQGGNLKDNFFPDIGYGLPLRKGQKELVAVPKEKKEQTIKVTSHYDLTNHDAVPFIVHTQYRGYSADYYRSYVKNVGKQEILKRYEQFYKTYYKEFHSIETLLVTDNRADNVIDVTEKYMIKHFKVGDGSGDEKLSSIFPSVIVSRLQQQPQLPRTFPFFIEYPVNIREEMVITSDIDWTDQPIHTIKKSAAAQISKKTFVKDKQLHIVFEYQTLTDHLQPEEIPDYISFLDKGLDMAEITINENQFAAPNHPMVAVLILTCFVFYGIWQIYQYKKKTRLLKCQI